MFDKFKISTVILAAALVYDVRVAHRNAQKFQNVLEVNQTLVDALNASERRVDYLLSMMDVHEVPITEFDRIVMNDLTT